MIRCQWTLKKSLASFFMVYEEKERPVRRSFVCLDQVVRSGF
jgi:hypothetical protein